MDLIAENVDGAVVLNIGSVCTGTEGSECKSCIDIGGLIHNWMMSTEVRYLIVDLQDEKDLCTTFLVELLQLRKRLRIPYLFAGVMERPRRILNGYAIFGDGQDVFITPSDAVAHLKSAEPKLLDISFAGITFGEPIVSLKARQAQRAEEVEEINPDDLE